MPSVRAVGSDFGKGGAKGSVTLPAGVVATDLIVAVEFTEFARSAATLEPPDNGPWAMCMQSGGTTVDIPIGRAWVRGGLTAGTTITSQHTEADDTVFLVVYAITGGNSVIRGSWRWRLDDPSPHESAVVDVPDDSLYITTWCANVASAGSEYTGLSAGLTERANMTDPSDCAFVSASREFTTGQSAYEPTATYGDDLSDYAAIALCVIQDTSPAHNLCPNPSVANNTTGWVQVSGSWSRVTADAGFDRANAMQVTGNNSGAQINAAAGSTPDARDLYCVSASAHADSAHVYGLNIGSDDGATTTFHGAITIDLPAGTVARGTMCSQVQSDATTVWPTFFQGTTTTGVDYQFGDIRITRGVRADSMTYRDGDSAGWEWDGTAGSSTSQESSTQTVNPAAVGSGEAFGSASVGLTVTPTGVPTGETFGSPSVAAGAVTVAPAGLATAETVGAATVAPGAATVAPGGVPSAEDLGSATLSPGAAQVSPSGVPSGELFGGATVTGRVRISPTGVASAELVGSHTVNAGAATVEPAGLGSAEQFGQPTVAAGTVTVTPTGVGSGEVVEAPTLAVTVHPSGVPSGEASGTPTVSAGAATVTPAGVTSGEAHGLAEVHPPVAAVEPVGIASTQQVGSHTVTGGDVTVKPGGVPTAEVLGTPGVIPGAVQIDPNGIGSTETVGQPVLRHNIHPTGIPTGEQVGQPALETGQVTIGPAGVPTGETVTNPTVTPGGVTLSPLGVPSASEVPAPTILLRVTIHPAGIVSAETVDQPGVTVGAVTVRPVGVASAEVVPSPNFPPGLSWPLTGAAGVLTVSAGDVSVLASGSGRIGVLPVSGNGQVNSSGGSGQVNVSGVGSSGKMLVI